MGTQLGNKMSTGTRLGSKRSMGTHLGCKRSTRTRLDSKKSTGTRLGNKRSKIKLLAVHLNNVSLPVSSILSPMYTKLVCAALYTESLYCDMSLCSSIHRVALLDYESAQLCTQSRFTAT